MIPWSFKNLGVRRGAFALGVGVLTVMMAWISLNAGFLQANLIAPSSTEVEGLTLAISDTITDNDVQDQVNFAFAFTMDEDYDTEVLIDGLHVEMVFPSSVVSVSNPTFTNLSDDGVLFDPVQLVDVNGGKRAAITMHELDMNADGNLFRLVVDYASFVEHTVEITGEVLTRTKNVYELTPDSYLVSEEEEDDDDDDDGDGGSGGAGPSGGGGGGRISPSVPEAFCTYEKDDTYEGGQVTARNLESDAVAVRNLEDFVGRFSERLREMRLSEVASQICYTAQSFSAGRGLSKEFTLVQDEDSLAALTVPKGVYVMDADGEYFEGMVKAPSAIYEGYVQPKDELVGSVYEAGVEGGVLSFSEEVKVRLPLPLDVAEEDLDYLYLAYFDNNTGLWKTLGDGGDLMKLEDGSMVLEVEASFVGQLAILRARDRLVVYDVCQQDFDSPFVDKAGHYAEEAIDFLYEYGVVVGYENETLFRPDRNINRAELTKMALFALGHYVPPRAVYISYEDVGLSEWFAPSVYSADFLGIVEGYEDGRFFRPGQNITRAEAMKIILFAAAWDIAGFDLTVFPDVANADWFFDVVHEAYESGIINGYDTGRFGPNDAITRGQVAIILRNMICSTELELLAGKEEI